MCLRCRGNIFGLKKKVFCFRGVYKVDEEAREIYMKNLKQSSKYEISVTRNKGFQRAGSLGCQRGGWAGPCRMSQDWIGTDRWGNILGGKSHRAKVQRQVSTACVWGTRDTLIWLERTVCIAHKGRKTLNDIWCCLSRALKVWALPRRQWTVAEGFWDTNNRVKSVIWKEWTNGCV